jgi:hypothetical protein
MLPGGLITKSKAAFLLSFRQLWNSNTSLYFWTFTWPCANSDWYYKRSWNQFCVSLVRRQPHDFQGLRVFEQNQRPGIHVHMVCNKRISTWLVKRLAIPHGLGRDDVRRCVEGDGDYLAKYLTKGSSVPGMRMWAKIGDWDHERVHDVQVISKESNFLRAAYLDASGPHGQRFVAARVALRSALSDGLIT